MTFHIITAYAWGLLPVGLSLIVGSNLAWGYWCWERRPKPETEADATEDAWEQANQL